MSGIALKDAKQVFDSFPVVKEAKSRGVIKKDKNSKLTPFVKWAGGKRGIISEIINRLPDSFNRYFEPFVGGGALLFELQPKQAFISDINQELIFAYLAIKNNPAELMKELDIHKKKHSEDYFYQIRDTAYSPIWRPAWHSEDYFYQIRDTDEIHTAIKLTGRFIYLNKTCFNGLYRVNKSGKFNVPSGKYPADKVTLYNKENIEKINRFLQTVEILVQDFSKIKPDKGDFVYFDPPYHRVFTQYTDKEFGHDQQVNLAKFVSGFTEKGIKVMVSNSDTDLTRELYKDLNINLIEAPRSVNCKADGRKGKELLITNY